MESREASTHITSNNSEDDSSLSFTYAWAKEAALLFQTGNFSDCLKLLSQLLRYKPADPKVNIISTYSDCLVADLSTTFEL